MFQKAPVTIDPRAQTLLDQLVQTHRALRSYRATVTVEGTDSERREASVASVVWERPGRCRVESKRGNGTSVLSFSDGKKRLYRGSTNYQGAAEPGERALVATLSDAGLFIAPIFIYLTSTMSPAKSLLPQPVTTLVLGNDTTLDGQKCNVVAAETAAGGKRSRLTLALGRTDHLLRRVTIEASRDGESLSFSELYTSVEANPRFTVDPFRSPR